MVLVQDAAPKDPQVPGPNTNSVEGQNISTVVYGFWSGDCSPMQPKHLDTRPNTLIGHRPCTGWNPSLELPMASAVVTAHPSSMPMGVRQELRLLVVTAPVDTAQRSMNAGVIQNDSDSTGALQWLMLLTSTANVETTQRSINECASIVPDMHVNWSPLHKHACCQ